MRAFRAETLTLLNDKLCTSIVHAPANKLDIINPVDVQIHNTISEAESMEWDFDLKDLWLTKSRWSMMTKQYIDPLELQVWIDKITSKMGKNGRGIAMMRTRTVAAQGGPAMGNKERRRWGSCMLAIGFKARPRPQITLYSRTSYLGYLGALDLSVAWMCGKYLARELKMDVAEMSFVWMNEALQYHNFKSLAYLLNHPNRDRRLEYRDILLNEDENAFEHLSPALTMSRKWIGRMTELDTDGKTLGDMNYNTYRRIRRRFHTEVLGYDKAQEFEGWSYHKKGPKQGEQKEYFKAYKPLPHVNIHDLDFSAIKMPFGRTYGDEYDDAGIDFDDEDED